MGILNGASPLVYSLHRAEWGDSMATKSIFKNIVISDNKTAGRLLCALEKSGNSKKKEVVLTKKCQTITGEKIKEMFGDK